MAMRSDVRLDWFKRFRPRQPVSDPRLDVDQFQDAHPLEIRDGPFTGKDKVERPGIDDAARSEASA